MIDAAKTAARGEFIETPGFICHIKGKPEFIEQKEGEKVLLIPALTAPGQAMNDDNHLDVVDPLTTSIGP